jgi:hypothetical protein
MMTVELSSLYEAFQALVPLPAFDPLEEVSALIAGADCLAGADDNGFTLQDGDSTRKVDLPGGLTQAHYHRLAPSLLDDDDKAILALAVIRRAIQPKTWLDWENIKTLARSLHRMAGDDNYEGMLLSIGSLGFAAVISDLKAKIAETPQGLRCRARLVVVEKPEWDGRCLRFGEKRWRFRRDNGPVNQLLDELENTKWRYPVRLPHLDPEQVREAGKLLRKKTRPVINWHAGNDGEFSWTLQ